MNYPLFFPSAMVGMLLAGAALAQTVTNGMPAGAQGRSLVTTPPSVDNGVANGVVKPSGAPSVSNGVANGIVKQPGAPSVGDGVANGTLKSTTTQQ